MRDAVAKDFIRRITANMHAYDKVVTGHAVDSWEHKAGSDIIGNTDQAMWVIEFGRMPGGDVPVKALEKWAARKFGFSASKAKGFARQAREKIITEGIPMTRVIRNTLREMAYA